MREMREGDTPRQVVWTSSKPPGVEFCTVRRRASGWVLGGSVVRRFKEGAAVITYVIETDPGWRTRKVTVEQVLDGRRRTLEMALRRSRWLVEGTEDSGLRGCIDVDLQASPVTNTLAIKRAALRVGSRVDLTAAWVKFPSLRVAPLRQSYERLGKRKYRYRSATGFMAEIEVDGFGLVARYGDYWLAV